MRTFLPVIFFVIALVLSISPVLAMNDRYAIDDINLNEENFLDIKAHRFRKSLEYQWYDNTSAWRITGASLDGDLAFLQNELKLQRELSAYVNVRLEIAQQVFYTDEEFPLPMVEVEIYPWAGDFGFSLLGTPAYEKREMDLGAAVIWGRRPWNYTRFEYLSVDALYNEKNSIDNTFYNKQPKAMTLSGNYQLGEHYKLRFSISRDKPLELIDPDNSGVFKNEGSDYFLLFDYQPVPDSVVGITVTGFTLDKSSVQTGQNKQQATDYVSVDVYWVKGMSQLYELRFGSQYDHITNDIRDFVTNSNDLDYFMKTLQVYSTVYHRFNEHMAWDFGLYIGQVEERQNYLRNSSRNTLNDSLEAKFRMGFEYSSADGLSSLQLNLSLNADDPVNDPGDGAGISFQSVF